MGVKLVEHSDPREPLEVQYWGLGYLSSLTEVVEKEMTTEDETSSDESDSVAIEPETNSSDEDEGKTQVHLKSSPAQILGIGENSPQSW